ncbi:methyltransferase domain-containing protein [Cryobacterium psychrophilum]|uniref:Methyltransferase domain-containing protein n=1 Tax=Cryobacterium psychrophilum TaxID=41988 RepID=A0A4Y8KPP6_9MICO|nr:methyltransferase domain-containing protein [Cryobacterium psychrophilum]TDW31325.1 methyltransferase family protein [Cryobacterium psychrophilum]TFD78396.1 methyltransferase domain-containing protein [Cryobacterium psychrophilum]
MAHPDFAAGPEFDDPEVAPRKAVPLDAYTHGHHESVLRSHTWRTVDNSAAYLAPELKPGMTLLDVGCGPGTITVDLARRVSPGRVVGIDASAQIIIYAEGLAVDEAVHNASFRVGNVYALDFDDASFDIVHAHQVVQHLSDPVAAMREIRRVLKPGGLFAARDVDYGGVAIYPALPGLEKWMETYRDVHFWNGGDPDAGRALKAWARRAGFASVAASASIWCFATDAEREWWGESWAVRATESSFAAHAIESGVADLAELRDIAAAWRTWVHDPDGWFAMPHGEILART